MKNAWRRIGGRAWRPAVLVALAAAVWGAGSTGCFQSTAEPTQQAADTSGEPRHEVRVESSRELGTLEVRVGEEEFAGVECNVCHTIPGQQPPATRPEELDEFHTAMDFAHGELTCNACHSADDRSKLKLADGELVAFEDTMTLCGQCHGPQMRDYRMGSHGGMTGYWDLTEGPRTRNNCVNCHDPHEPAFPSMAPAPPPRDRFLTPEQH